MSKYIYGQKYSLRDVIGGYMQFLGHADRRVVVVNADLMGTCRTRSFMDEFSDRTFNTGIAEQNMVSFAAGLAHEGFVPYAFSMAPFISMRACEQCRTDVAYAGLNVRLMGTYAGYSGGISGATHWGLEDCAVFTGISDIAVVEICDPYEAERLLLSSIAYKGPIYFRSGIEPVRNIYNETDTFEIGRAKIVRQGEDGAFICSGITVSYALEAAKQLEIVYGKNIRVIDMHTIKPIDENAIIEAAETGTIIVAQDHNVFGGLGSMVAGVLAQNGIGINFRILGCNQDFIPMAHAQYLYHENQYDSEGLYNNMAALLELH